MALHREHAGQFSFPIFFQRQATSPGRSGAVLAAPPGDSAAESEWRFAGPPLLNLHPPPSLQFYPS
jgi:hypothetical protein